MKCLPASKLAEAKGVAIHDWHAEVLAIRTLNRYLLDECQSIVDSKHDGSGAILQRNEDRHEEYTTPFRIRDDVKFHMYCSEAPCKLFSLLLLCLRFYFTAFMPQNDTIFARHQYIISLTDSI
jgi:tRNA-specific adenosine deaminase 1